MIKTSLSPLAGILKENPVLYGGLSQSDKSCKMIQVNSNDFNLRTGNSVG